MSKDTLSNAALALRLQGVSRRFGGVEAVRDVSLDIAYGERRVILGPNGAGKSTLFNLIAGEFGPTAGRVVLFGEDVTRRGMPYRARHGLSRTYQTTHLFLGLSARDNLFLAARGVEARRMSWLRPGKHDRYLAKALEVATHVGLEQVLDRKVGELSHGEQRQLELAMALAGHPRMIILDEPAAGLSQGERARLTALIQGLDQAMTVLMIEHDMDIALQVAELVTVMHNGRVIVNGTPDEIRANIIVHELYLGERHDD